MHCHRNYGIDCLRLLLMFMVCVLHVLGRGGILSACIEDTVSYQVFWLLEVFAYCAVDGFAFISGYTARNKPHDFSKIVNMWFQVWFYSFVVSMLLTFIGLDGGWSLKTIIKRLLPVTFSQYWYFTAYFALFFAIPILNAFLFNISKMDSKRAFVLLFALFSIMGAVSDPFETKAGYSAIWLIAIYCMGVLAKRSNLFEQKRTITLVLFFLVFNLATWLFYTVGKIDRILSYTSPTVLLSGIVLVVIFSRLSLKGHLIRYLSPLAFGIYLFQLNSIMWNEVLHDAFIHIVNQSLVVGIIHVFAYAFLIFIAGLFIEFIRNLLMPLLGINRLSSKIVNVANRSIEKLFVFLE